MKPVAIFQHDALQGPGYLLRFLDDAGIASCIVRPSEGDAVPRTARSFAGIVLLGSDSSVNDTAPWIGAERRLVADAIASDVPILGHCFGGQLLASVLGAPVRKAPAAEIGWSRLRVTPAAVPMLGNRPVLAFNWHYETFAIPAGATRTLFAAHCLNKGFAFGRHLAFQSHFEVTEATVRDWCEVHHAELAAASGPAVQTAAEIMTCLPERAAIVHETAARVYAHWARPMTQPPRQRHFGAGFGRLATTGRVAAHTMS